MVVNDHTLPVGVFIPGLVAERLPNSHMVISSSQELQNAVRTALAAGDLVRAIEAIEGEHTEFHSETLNQNSPDPYVCENHGKPHKRSKCPCDIHPGASCGRREVASR
jgi:hypothetical protein